MVLEEADLVTERVNSRMVTDALLLQGAVSGILSKDGRKQFSKLIKQLNVTVEPKLGIHDDLD